MDEATSAMDDTTAALIHRVLLEYFSECTILTIAHRLHHIFDYNKVLVLDNGKVRILYRKTTSCHTITPICNTYNMKIVDAGLNLLKKTYSK